MEFRLRKLAFPHDQVWMTAGGAAAAVWLPPPGRWQLSRPQRLRLLPALVRFLGLRTVSVRLLGAQDEQIPVGPIGRMPRLHALQPSQRIWLMWREPRT